MTRASDKVQVMSAVGAVQSAGHDKQYGIDSIVPAPSTSSGQALAKSARTGHRLFWNGKEKAHRRLGHPSGRGGWIIVPQIMLRQDTTLHVEIKISNITFAFVAFSRS
jgi:hypothetical protein